MTNQSSNFPQTPVKNYPKAGVIYVMEEAAKHGFTYASQDWANLGQGMPDVTQLPGSLPRINEVSIANLQQGYAPVAGVNQLRDQVATLYNQLFRLNHASQFRRQNICVAGGGRLTLARIFATLEKDTKIGYFLPDYASYEGLLSIFNNTQPVAIPLKTSYNYKINLTKLAKVIDQEKITALLLSNPTNPTGSVVAGDELKKLLALAKEKHVLLILDEFYFNYIYQDEDQAHQPSLVSAAEFIEDVNADPVLMISGLSKGWRYPGWRITWVLGPQAIIDSIASVGSFLDGGANHPLQQAACEIVNYDNFIKESSAIQKEFDLKRRYMLERLTDMAIQVENDPVGAFYIWANLSQLPAPINDGMRFFQEGLKEKVTCVPGIFFDLNPYQQRLKPQFKNYVRFSYSAKFEIIKMGLDAYERVVKKFK